MPGMTRPADTPLLLRTAGLTKDYATRVLDSVDLEILEGEVHALVGENGAGKSTLARILAGLIRPDAGHIELAGEPYAPSGKRQAEAQGVRMVMQELNVIGRLTVAESIFFGHLPHRWGAIDYPGLHRAARPLMDQVGLSDVAPDRPLETLGVGRQQMVEIAAALSRQCRLLILDEPTAALTAPEIERLFDQIRRLGQQGVSFLYISHRMEEIQRISDRISVLRDGRLLTTRGAAGFGLDEVVRLMVGRPLEETRLAASRPPNGPALRVDGLAAPPALRHASFELRFGEILGLAGLMGAGRTEMLRAIFGADRRAAGRICLRGSSAPARIDHPRDAVRQGIALLTEDRKAQGLLLPLSVLANVTLNHLRPFCRAGGRIQAAAERRAVEQWLDQLGVRCRSPLQPVAELSGGNQQKVLMARWLHRNCDILLLDEPTRGIDVGARFEIHRLLRQGADQGRAILMASSDLRELLGVCDRIGVMSAGRWVATFDRNTCSQDDLLHAALSGYTRTHP